MATTVAGGVSDTTTIAASIAEISLEDISSRHRKERKELQAKIQALKKNAPKSDKRKRKEVLEEIARMERDFEQHQAEELNNLNNAKSQNNFDKPTSSDINQKDTANDEGKEDALPRELQSQQRVSKAQKRRDKKSRESKQREAEILAACQDDNSTAPKTIETAAIVKLLKERHLMLHHVASDGDCLYNAIRHQLVERGIGNYTVSQLRNETANYIAANKEALIPFMTNQKTGNPLTDDEFIDYCENVRNTSTWGGQIELKALSSFLKVPIMVLQATGSPTVQGSEEFLGQNLIITYHRHMYSLGEHYNSTKELGEAEDRESDAE